jgi:tetratricopeptide (TPR) repeat protein
MAKGHCCFALTVCLFIGLQAFPAAAQQSDFTNGVRLYQEGEYQQAAQALETATNADPALEAAWYYLGLTRFKLADYPGSLAALQKALELAPGRPGTRLMIGQIYESQNAFNEAIGVYQDEARYRRGRDILPVVRATGRALYRAGRYTEALSTLQKVISDDPNDVEAVYYLALTHAAMGNHTRALIHFANASRIMDEWWGLSRRLTRLRKSQASGDLTPAQQRDLGASEERMAQDYGRAQEFGTLLGLWPTLNKATGNSYLALKEFASARNAYRKALDREQLGSPSDPDVFTLVALAHLGEAKTVFNDQGLIFQAIGISGDAITSAKEAIQKNAAYAPAHNALGEIYLFQAKTYTTRPDLNVTSHTCADADKEFQEALKLDPNYVLAMSNYAECLLLSGQAEEAKVQLEKALTLQPRNANLHAQLAQVLLSLEAPEEALKEAQNALLLDKNNVEALNAAGMFYLYFRNDLGEATDYFTRAVAADPRRWDSYVNLGLAFYQMESWYRARREFRQGLELIPKAVIANTSQQQAYLYYLIARTYHATSMFDQEVEALNEALGRTPTHVETLRQLALAYEAQRKYRAAEQTLQDALNASSGPADDAAINVQIASMLEHEGKTHEAIAAYSAALKADPNSAAAQQGLSRLQNR